MRFAEHNFVGKVWAGVYLDTLGAVYDVIWSKRESSGRTPPAMSCFMPWDLEPGLSEP